MKITRNPQLMNNIIFTNDVLHIPPVKVFLKLNEGRSFLTDLTVTDKKFLGAFWGYIFKFIFCYKGQKLVGIGNPYIKTATYFLQKDVDIRVTEE